MLNAKDWQYVAKTPKSISPKLLEFCKHLNSGSQPELVAVHPLPSSEQARCYQNVEVAKELMDGGETQLGWALWELAGVYITAEHHAVLAQNGKLIDVSPQLGGEEEILFLRDTVMPHDRTNRYWRLSERPIVKQICKLQRRNCWLHMNGGFCSREFLWNDSEAARLLDTFYAQMAKKGKR